MNYLDLNTIQALQLEYVLKVMGEPFVWNAQIIGEKFGLENASVAMN